MVDAPAGVTQEKGHTGFLHLPSAGLPLTLIATRIQRSFFLVGREVELVVLHLLSIFLIQYTYSIYIYCFYEEKSQFV